jgi:uncharacterized membrane protein YjgN (DUF898 family)
MSDTLPYGSSVPDVRKIEFTGTAREWFGVWIVNLLLSIITIGIYSAWAKVRTKKYFYNHTLIEGRSFDYHATGGQIFKGRLMVIGALIVFQIISAMAPVLGLILALVLLLGYPWLILRAMMFNARMSSFSNVRFGFDGTTGQAMLLMLVYPIGVLLTLYTTFPILDRALKRFSIGNARLGGARFAAQFPLGPFYKALGVALAWVLGVTLLGTAVLGFSWAGLMGAMMDAEGNPMVFMGYLGLIYLLFFAAFLPAAFIYQALTRNVVYNNTTLAGGHRLTSNVTAPALLWIAVSNMVVVICTLFLMLPWAQIRLARYLADHTGYVLGGSLDTFLTEAQTTGNAIGDAYADFEGMGAGLPV